jgi:flagellar operon protein
MVDDVTGFRPTRISPADLESRISRGHATDPSDAAGGAFAEILQSQTDAPLRFSAHAQQRLQSRQIELTDQDRANLTRAVEMAGQKGAKESLILIDDLSLIVSIRNRVVITAMERGQEDASVFTQIDSAVVLPRSGAPMGA